MGKNHRAPITALSDLCINLRIKFPVKFMSLSYMCINHCPTLTVDIYFGIFHYLIVKIRFIFNEHCVFKAYESTRKLHTLLHAHRSQNFAVVTGLERYQRIMSLYKQSNIARLPGGKDHEPAIYDPL
jgi:hypothetical protein